MNNSNDVAIETKKRKKSTVPSPVISKSKSVKTGNAHKKIRVAIIGTVGLPAKYGGFESLAQYLVKHLQHEFDFTVYCSSKENSEKPKQYLGARLVYFPFRANGAQSVIYDVLNYSHALFNADVCLILGVSGGLALPFFTMFKKPTLLNIGGMDWQRSKWGKWPSRFLHLSEAIAVKAASEIISDNQGITYHIKKAYRRGSTLIEYGGDQITRPPITEAMISKYPFLSRPYAFSLARIQSDNNPELLLYAFNQVPETEFVFVGNWQKSEYGRKLKKQYEGYPNLHLIEAIYDANELNVIRAHCAYYVHGHSAGGTNPALVEAMSLSLPIAAFDVIYNRATTENQVRYFQNVATLAELILQMSQEEWDAQRSIVKEIADRRYRWEIISKKYGEIFKRVMKKPSGSIVHTPQPQTNPVQLALN